MNAIDGAVVEGDNFIGRDLAIENSAGPEMKQAVALLVAGDKSIFYNCRIDGHQDSLCTHNHRQFYRDCTVSGTVDFVFGNARAVLQNCTLIVNKPAKNQSCVVTAQGRSVGNETSALVLQSCQVVPGPDYPVGAQKPATFLGRPWKPRSRTVVMDTQLDGFIDPTGWAEWNATTHFLDTSWYAEVDNRGPGAALERRASSPGIKRVSAGEAEAFTPGKLLGDYWIAGLGIPYSSGRIRA